MELGFVTRSGFHPLYMEPRFPDKSGITTITIQKGDTELETVAVDTYSLFGFAKLAIDLVEPATVKKSINRIYCISVLLNMLGFSQKELMCVSPRKFVGV
ncbi:hypothetical protein [Haloarcula brevis]|uniref:hypothetical protein n=1 Tax=Haloarcula brevis TaxID=3111453 RepID=UPI00300EF517